LLYNVFKYTIFVWAVRLLFRPRIEGAENIPRKGPAILASNHISAGDTFLVPALIRRRLTFPAKQEMFHGKGLKGRALAWFLRVVGQVPMDRSGGRASAGGMDNVLQVLRDGKLLGIYPEGTRSPDGRLYKGKTGVARLVLQAGVPVVPLAVIGTQFVPSVIPKVPTMMRPLVRIGEPLDFSAYASAGNDREVLRWVTDRIMEEVMILSGQEYVDAYGSTVKTALAEGKPAPPSSSERPGAGKRVPPVPAARS
jgi:1-acyl-sn-glycerol-3-phosphate acyltransferase